MFNKLKDPHPGVYLFKIQNLAKRCKQQNKVVKQSFSWKLAMMSSYDFITVQFQFWTPVIFLYNRRANQYTSSIIFINGRNSFELYYVLNKVHLKVMK